MQSYRQIYALSIHSFSETLIQTGFSCISSEKQTEMRAYENQHDQIRSLGGELLIRLMVCSMFNLKNENVKMSYNEDGKPSILGFPSFHFNISHAGEWIVLIADTNKIGIDIEHHKEINFTKVANRFFSSEEISSLIKRTNHKHEFYKIWTLKESFIKAVGKGLTFPLTTFSVLDGESQMVPIDYQEERFHFQNVYFRDDYSLSICFLADEPNHVPVVITAETLLQNLSNHANNKRG